MTYSLVAVGRSVVSVPAAWTPVPALLPMPRVVERPVPMALPGVALPGTMAPSRAVPRRPVGVPVARLPALVLVSMVRLPVVVLAAGVPTRVPTLAQLLVLRVVRLPRLRVVLPGVGGRRG
ncbi:MAG: hypothetical protein IRZ07_21800, partial [Microbispora sp.]|nr:hypothetical protein [Microbispora sp.]